MASRNRIVENAAKEFRSVLYFHDTFYAVEASRENPAAFLHLSDLVLMKVFDEEIRPVIESNLGALKEARIGSKLGGDGWGYVEFIADGESYHVAPRVFVFECPRYEAQSVVAKSYEEEKKSWFK